MVDPFQVICQFVTKEDAEQFIASVRARGVKDINDIDVLDGIVVYVLWKQAVRLVVKAVYNLCIIRLRGRI